jgi:enoyl-CoA hydratase
VVITEVAGPVATITIQRPQALNALNREVLEELGRAVDALEAQPDVAVVVLAASGAKAFVAGADIAEMVGFGGEEAKAFSRMGQAVMDRLAQSRLVSIAAVQGFALGGGFELALCCDIIVAGARAVFGLPEVKLAVIPGFGGTQRLARLVGPQRAKYLALSGQRVAAAQAYAWGICAVLCEPDQPALAQAQALARDIASGGALALRAAKRCINQGLDLTLSDGLALENEAFGAMFRTSDQKEGMTAFMDKRAARFEGR